MDMRAVVRTLMNERQRTGLPVRHPSPVFAISQVWPTATIIRGGLRGVSPPAQIPYIAVDEANGRWWRWRVDQVPRFIVSAPAAGVAGRCERAAFSSGDDQKQYWKNWSPREDWRAAQWEKLFGPNFHGLLVFAYNIVGDRAPLPAEQLFEYREPLRLRAVPLDHYADHCHAISPSWEL
jgi:hypothetical protein